MTSSDVRSATMEKDHEVDEAEQALNDRRWCPSPVASAIAATIEKTLEIEAGMMCGAVPNPEGAVAARVETIRLSPFQKPRFSLLRVSVETSENDIHCEIVSNH